MKKWVLALVVAMLATGASANVLQYSFEGPDPGSGQYVYPGFSSLGSGWWDYLPGATLDGWTVVANPLGGGSTGVDVIRDAYSPVSFPDGHQALDMNGWAQGAIEKTIPTIPGNVYQVSFWISDNSTGGVLGTDVNGFATIPTGPFNGSPAYWNKWSFTFTGSGIGSDTIRFSALAPPGASGVTLDDIQISDLFASPAIPLPAAAWTGMVLLSGVVVGRIRRFTKAL
ncbi:MAG: hypothetical protein ABSH20_00330 [Tepidisphaeraceae bacterium]|jgi:hypothetical protein